jgi:hypothetical protein
MKNKKLKGINPKDKLGLKKIPLRLTPPTAYIYQSMAHNLGGLVKGYGPYNWRDKKAPVRYSVYLEAIFRHMLLAMDGEDMDDESLAPHEASIMAGCSIIMDAKLNNNLVDDRHKTGTLKNLMKTMEKKLQEQQELYNKKKKSKK